MIGRMVYVINKAPSEEFLCVYEQLKQAVQYCTDVLKMEYAEHMTSAHKINIVERVTTTTVALINIGTNEVVGSFHIHTTHII